MPGCFYRHGYPVMADYTPGADAAAGDVVVTNDTPRIVHVPVAANQLGAIAVAGGVYAGTVDGAIAADKVVYWDAAAGKLTLTVGSNKKIGRTITAATANNQTVLFFHSPPT